VTRYRHAAASTQVERQFQSWRVGPSTISHVQIVALAGEVYRLFVDKFHDNPGSPDNWAALKAFNRAAKEGRLSNAPSLVPGEMPSLLQASAVFGSSLAEGVDALPAQAVDRLRALEFRFGRLTDWVLQRHGLVIDLETRAYLLRHILDASTDAAWSLRKKSGRRLLA
jgi:hypothetical protein